MTGQSVFASTSLDHASFKAACVVVGDYSLRLFPVNTHHTMTMMFKSSEQQWRWEGRPKIIPVLTTSPTGWVSAPKCHNGIHGGVVRNIVGLSWEMYCQQKWKQALKQWQPIYKNSKALITPAPRWDSSRKLHIWVSAQRCIGGCKQSLPRYPKCQSKTCYQKCGCHLINYLIMWHNFLLLYQECNCML